MIKVGHSLAHVAARRPGLLPQRQGIAREEAAEGVRGVGCVLDQLVLTPARAAGMEGGGEGAWVVQLP